MEGWGGTLRQCLAESNLETGIGYFKYGTVYLTQAQRGNEF